MIRRIPFFLILYLMLNAASIHASEKAHTPASGSAERRSIVDALRRDYSQPHKGKLTFNVKYLKVNSGWAWIYAEPRSSDPRDRFGETNGFLLHNEGGEWKVMKLPPMVDDPNDPEGLDYPRPEDVKRIKRMYHSVPNDIFPAE